MCKKIFLITVIFLAIFNIRVYASADGGNSKQEYKIYPKWLDPITTSDMGEKLNNLTSTFLNELSIDASKEYKKEIEKERKKQEALEEKKKQDELKENTIYNVSGLILNNNIERNITEDEYNNICKLVESEAGGQGLYGKILVANVVFNRIDSPRFHYNTVNSVIFAKNQFSPVSNGRFYTVSVSDETKDAVDLVLSGIDYSNGATFFMNRDYSTADNVSWFDTDLDKLFKYRDHTFYKNK